MAPLTPMLATTGALPPDNDEWVFEGKWDGVRALVSWQGGRLSIRSRRDLDTTAHWPELATLGEGLPDGTLLDGEIVTLGPTGAPSFELLQSRMNVRQPAARLVAEVPVVLMCFDVLTLAGRDVIGLPWSGRRELLDGLALGSAQVQAPPAFPGPGAAVLAACTAQGLEGVMAKRIASPYLPGQRSPDWVKVKPKKRQEVLIGGWSEGDGGRAGQLGALLIGVYDGGSLVYAGKVGTGFTQRTLGILGAQLATVAAARSPFVAGVPAVLARSAHWVRPELVCEVEFLAWTADGKLRHPSYKGMRMDKDPREVVREPDGA